MKVKELKEILNDLSEEDLELDVRVFTDHGQHVMPCHNASTDYIYDDEYMAKLVHSDDIDENSIKVFLISD